MRKEYDFSKGKRGATIPPDPRKTRITIRIDTKILNWFRERVHEAGGGNYQTMINDALKSYIESDHSKTIRYPGGAHVDLDNRYKSELSPQELVDEIKGVYNPLASLESGIVPEVIVPEKGPEAQIEEFSNIDDVQKKEIHVIRRAQAKYHKQGR
jgi:hypothetical protein